MSMNDHFAPDLTPLGPTFRGRSNYLETTQGPFPDVCILQAHSTPPQGRVPGHPGFLALLDKMRRLHLAKDRDYSGQNEPFSNFRNANRIGVKASVGAYIRFQDKVARLENLLAMEAVGEQPSNESIEDNLMDVGAYALIILCLREEERVGHD